MSASREHAGGGGGKPRGTGVVGRYLTDSRNPLNTVLLLLPIFLIYSAGLLMTGGVRNGVDLVSDLVRGWVFRGDDLHYLLFNLTGMAVVVLVALVLRKQNQFRPGIYLVVLAEGTLYGLLLGSLVTHVLALLPVAPPRMALAAGAPGPFGVFDGVILSLGAGLWEELVFRWLLLGGMVRLLELISPVTGTIFHLRPPYMRRLISVRGIQGRPIPFRRAPRSTSINSPRRLVVGVVQSCQSKWCSPVSCSTRAQFKSAVGT